MVALTEVSVVRTWTRVCNPLPRRRRQTRAPPRWCVGHPDANECDRLM